MIVVGGFMKIKIINPDYGMTKEQLKKRINILNKVVRNDTILSMECLKESFVVIDSMLDVYLAAPEIINMAIKAEKEGYDAIVLYCFSDPAISACREILSIPVIGAGQSSILTACELGYKFSLIVNQETRIPEKRLFVNSLGIGIDRLASIRSLNIPYEVIEKDRKYTLLQLTKIAEECINKDGAEVIVLGCLTFLGMADELFKSINIPVVDPGYNAVCVAESFISQGLTHSKRSHPYPKSGVRESARIRLEC